MYKKYILIAFFLVSFLIYLFYIIGTTKVTVYFEDFEPFKHHIPVYYNGFKLGHTTKVYPSKDFKLTLVDLRLNLKNLKLPINTIAIIRRKDKKDYIELDYPDAPYLQILKDNDKIKGHMGVNFEHYLQEQAQNGGLDEIKGNVNQTIVSAGETFDALTGMIQVLTGILEDVRPTINDTVKNVNLASKNVADSSSKIKESIDKGYVDKALYNLQETSGNLVITTQNFNGFTSSLNQQSTRLTNCLLKNLNIVIGNINEIIVGVGNTLKKKLGGLRLVFNGIDSCK